MDEGICPANIYKDNDGNDQVCFDNAGECRTQSKFKNHEMQDAETSFFEKKEKSDNSEITEKKHESFFNGTGEKNGPQSSNQNTMNNQNTVYNGK